MNKKQKNLLISLITILFLIEFLCNSNLLINVFFQAINLCFYNLLPNIFIFFLITDILNNYHFSYYLSKLFGNLFNRIYHLSGNSSFCFFMSLTSGFPGNSKLIKDALDNQDIDIYEANRLLTMTHFANPLFIIYTVGNLFKDQNIGLIILISHFITNLINGLLFKNIYHYEKKDNHYSMKESLSFINLLKTSFLNTTKLLINIFGIIIFFTIITTILSKYLNLNPFSNMLFTGLMEMTNGLKLLSLLSISKIKASMLATFFISFGGISIHMQTMAILNKYQINYWIYLLSRLIHGGISAILTAVIMSYCYHNGIIFI